MLFAWLAFWVGLRCVCIGAIVVVGVGICAFGFLLLFCCGDAYRLIMLVLVTCGGLRWCVVLIDCAIIVWRLL